MHGKEDYTERRRVARFDHGDQVFERTQFDAGETEPLSGRGKNYPPELLSGLPRVKSTMAPG